MFDAEIREHTEKIIPPRRAEGGKIIAKDLLTSAGQLLFLKGTELAHREIEMSLSKRNNVGVRVMTKT